uniref:Protein NATD1 n=1 Tax=Callorhinchus milii TaxID=7868 RepID=A0A4W3H5F7_CALMI
MQVSVPEHLHPICANPQLRSHERAVLLYEYVGKKTVDLQHTEVPDAYRGRGIAKLMAKVHQRWFIFFKKNPVRLSLRYLTLLQSWCPVLEGLMACCTLIHVCKGKQNPDMNSVGSGSLWI